MKLLRELESKRGATMMEFDSEARVAVEQNVDAIIMDALIMEEAFSYTLSMQGIEPNLETLLSFICGGLYGLINGIYHVKHGRSLNSDEAKEVDKLIKRRAWEVRQAFMGTRMS
jgi:hypothetical protein